MVDAKQLMESMKVCETARLIKVKFYMQHTWVGGTKV